MFHARLESMKKHTARCEHHKDGPDFCTVGIDVSKHHLDVCELPSGCEARFSNTKEGVRAFGAWVCPRVARVVYESTGSYHLLLEDLLVDRLPLSRINPKRGKRFAEALGSEAKTDRADALVLAKMGRAMADDLMETPVRTRREKDRDELRAARDAVNKALTVLKGRREHARNRLVRREIEKDIARAKRQIGRLDQELERLVAADAELSRKVALLETIPGIARLPPSGCWWRRPNWVRSARARPEACWAWHPCPMTLAVSAGNGPSRVVANERTPCCTCQRWPPSAGTPCCGKDICSSSNEANPARSRSRRPCERWW